MPRTALAQYAQISIAFDVHDVLDLGAGPNGVPKLIVPTHRLASPYVKDYDAIDGGPTRWAERFDLSAWGFLVATIDGKHVGGTAVVIDTTGDLGMAGGRDDVAVMWDLRVSTGTRRQGVGASLFRAAEAWATTKGCRRLEVETQNNNVPACRFYERQGCVLKAGRRGAYPELPDEIQLLWSKDLSPS